MAEAAKKLPVDAEVVRIVPPLAQNRWNLKEHANPGHWVCVPADTEVADLLEPGFWANHAQRMRPNSTLEVHWDDSSRFILLYVVSAGRNWADVDLMFEHKIKSHARPSQTHRYEAKYNGPVDLWRITNLSNGSVLKAGFATEEDARKFLAEHLKKF
ncbi:MAG TPA: hypothetical protein VNH21_03125 [Steroidobacteraceae bacterium]|nr:hypothetical protein [Steroidobacteraceae bacterium]